jgi:hypothetical protein
MKATSFGYDEKLLASCASSDDVRFVLSQDADTDTDASLDPNRIPHACRTLLEQHAQHYGRPLTDQEDANGHIRRFLESILLLQDFNQRDGNSNNPLTAAPPEEEWLRLWKDEDWETQTMGEVSLIRLHNEDSIQKAQSFHFSHDATRRQLRTHPPPTFVSPFDSYYPSLKIAQDNDFRETDIATTTRRTHSHKASQVDTFSALLNWATDQNPDGVPIVHPVHDQV